MTLPLRKLRQSVADAEQTAAVVLLSVDSAEKRRSAPLLFDVRGGARFAHDEEGLEFDSLDAAEHEAACMAAEIGQDRLTTGDSRAITVEVRNEHRQRVLTIKVSMEVDRVEPPPAPPHA